MPSRPLPILSASLPGFSSLACALAAALLFPTGPTATPLRAAEPELAEARVTMSYGELKALLEAAGERGGESGGAAPPVGALLGEARYRLDLSGERPVLEADFIARTFTEGWHALPLVGGTLRLEQAEFREGDGGETAPEAPRPAVLWQDGGYVLLARGAGEFGLTLRFGVTGRELGERGDPGEGLLLRPAPASVGELRVAGVPAGRAFRVEGLEPEEGETGERRYALPAMPGELRLALEDEPAEEATEPGHWVLHSQVLVRYRDGRLVHEARLQARAEGGPGTRMVLALPPKSAGIAAEGEGLASSRQVGGRSGERLVELEWSDREGGDRQFQLSWEIPQSPLASEWEIVPPQVRAPGAEGDDEAPHPDSRSIVALLPVDGLQWRHPRLSGRESGLRLPDWLRERAGDEAGFVAELDGAEGLALEVEWLPRLETAQATVSEADFETRLVADGSMLVQARYRIQHAGPMDWLLELPETDQVLACEVGGAAVRPVRRGEGGIEFRLPSPGGGGGSDGTVVTVSYAAEVPALDPLSGAVSLELPLTGLFIHRLEWRLHLPEAYEASAVEGNVQLANGGGRTESGGILLEKLLCRGERPAVELHYQRRDLETEK